MAAYECSTNLAPPVIDTILTTTNVASAIYVAGKDNVQNKGASVGLGLSVATLWLFSAIYGYQKTSECQLARDEQRGPGTLPLRRRLPPPYAPAPAREFRQEPPAPVPAPAPAPVVGPAPDGAAPTVPQTPAKPSARQIHDNDDPE